ncbi:DUF6668 family protein [Streptomyces sp. WAC 01325]|uniref:DUF6668 family protein n=1 Tax=Streptomyces sp. WAC 01325 TaxID=2203202 RepID=UPI00163D261B|nr:DUF6668 family protein [Streptomyces sp. WAC 01325]
MHVRRRQAPGFSWVSAHGGAGATTLAEVLGGSDVGARWPDPAEREPSRIVLVARTHATGLKAASRAMDFLRSGRHPPGLELTALVLVADAPGRLPIALSRRVRVLSSAGPTFRVPWIPAWRVGERSDKALSSLADLATFLRSGSLPHQEDQ